MSVTDILNNVDALDLDEQHTDDTVPTALERWEQITNAAWQRTVRTIFGEPEAEIL